MQNISHLTFHFCRIMLTFLKGAATVFYLAFMVKQIFCDQRWHQTCIFVFILWTVVHLSLWRESPARKVPSRAAAVCSNRHVCWWYSSRLADCVAAGPCMPSVNSVTSLGLPPLLSHSSPWNYIRLMSLKPWPLSKFVWHLPKNSKIGGEWQWDQGINLVSLGNPGKHQNPLDYGWNVLVR